QLGEFLALKDPARLERIWLNGIDRQGQVLFDWRRGRWRQGRRAGGQERTQAPTERLARIFGLVHGPGLLSLIECSFQRLWIWGHIPELACQSWGLRRGECCEGSRWRISQPRRIA